MQICSDIYAKIYIFFSWQIDGTSCVAKKPRDQRKSQMAKRVAAKLHYRYHRAMSSSLWREMVCTIWFSIAVGYFTLFHSRIIRARARYKVSHNVLDSLFTRIPFLVSNAFFSFLLSNRTLHQSSIVSPFVSRFVFNRIPSSPDSKGCRRCNWFSRNDTAYIPHRRAGFSQRHWETIPRSRTKDIRNFPFASGR